MKPKEKGDLAVSYAIHYFMTNGYEVSLPIGDKRDYDMIVEIEGSLSRVQVKYAGLYPGMKSCKVALRTTGGNQSFHTSKKYTDDAFDLLFVYTAKNEKYLLPWDEITARNELTIEHSKYTTYKIT
jgi:hypothetical protein